MKLLTREEILKKYAGKFINIYPQYDYSERKYLFDVRSVKSKIWENHSLPEEALENYQD